ncbi:hypothetical protein VNO80_15058 [Phaseolus coccineus]|uniref:Uncharacterized protein n=1 Tax=Phaseolus coccineus TaxID=3886 RepID=A0AAN9MKX8_PHACN
MLLSFLASTVVRSAAGEEVLGRGGAKRQRKPLRGIAAVAEDVPGRGSDLTLAAGCLSLQGPMLYTGVGNRAVPKTKKESNAQRNEGYPLATVPSQQTYSILMLKKFISY